MPGALVGLEASAARRGQQERRLAGLLGQMTTAH